MSVKGIRWWRSRRNHLLITIVLIALLYYILTSEPSLDQNLTRRYIERRIEEALKDEKGTGCTIPKLDPFAQEVMQFEKDIPPLECGGEDWVRCDRSVCKVTDQILKTYNNIQCTYKDIIYKSDAESTLGPVTNIAGSKPYILRRSDHVKVFCRADNAPVWHGYAIGFREMQPKPPPVGRNEITNVFILGFDSTSKNGFIRRMPKSYKVLTEDFGAVILNGYNIAGDGTPAALFPIFTGKTELELPDVRRSIKNPGHLDSMPFIFYQLKNDGYRTAYFEDMPWIGTFQYRFTGFQHQPADHYLRHFFMQVFDNGRLWWKKGTNNKYCVGDTPSFALRLNLTRQFFRLDSKKFMFNFIADITHDDFNMISVADDIVEQFLKDIKKDGVLDNTLFIMMGDHGPRYANVRDTLQGKQEERLPLMAFVLPPTLLRKRPDALVNLRANAKVLTSPFDIHTTLLEYMDLTQYRNHHKIPGAELTRALSLFDKIPANRSCSEAGIEPHWCACLRWRNVAASERVYMLAAEALVAYINALTDSQRSKCEVRTLLSIEWVMRQTANPGLLRFKKNKDVDGYLGQFGELPKITKEFYQIKIAVAPGRGVYEASMSYNMEKESFSLNKRDISRINAYNDEPSCISAINPSLNMYCYCKIM